MLEKRNKRLFVLLVVLIASTAVAYWYGREDGQDTLSKRIFSDYDVATIDRVLLESPAGAISLNFTGSRWKINDEYPADPSMIDVLFATLEQAEPRRPVASALQDSVAATLRKNGTKISLYQEGAVRKTFIAGGNTAKSQAYFLDTDTGTSYLMTIPGYRVYVSGIFELPPLGWRDKFVFGFNWRNFQSLESQVAKSPDEGFVVAMQGDYFSIQGLVAVDTTKLNDFLDDVSLLTVESYIPATRVLDSLAATPPYATVSVKDVAANEYRLALYFSPVPNRQYIGHINGSSWALMAESGVAKIVKPRSYFAR